MDQSARTATIIKNGLKFALIGGYVATIPIANWMIGNIGTFCVPNGPCLIPVGFGMTAPSGVLMVGLALVLRDFVQEHFGKKWAFAAIAVGAVLSYLLADPFIAFASFVAFFSSELLDFLVYSKIRERGKPMAIAVSGMFGAAADSVLFLYLAFGSLNHVEGQIFAKVMIGLIIAGLFKLKEVKNERSI